MSMLKLVVCTDAYIHEGQICSPDLLIPRRKGVLAIRRIFSLVDMITITQIFKLP